MKNLLHANLIGTYLTILIEKVHEISTFVPVRSHIIKLGQLNETFSLCNYICNHPIFF